jgi:enamine deaminase RidA (YjgF/YER057c/UK114 family)
VSWHGRSSRPRTRRLRSDKTALTNCEAILQAGGAGLDDVIEVGVLLTDPADFAA